MKRTSFMVAAVLGLGLAGGASAAFNAYLKISTIPGESTHAGEGGWIEVGSIQWTSGAPNLNTLRPGATATGGPGALRFDLRPGASSRLLRRAFDSKQRFARVQLEVPKPGQEAVHYKIVLTDVVISSIDPRAQYGGGGSSGRSTESFSLNFMIMEYKTPVAPLATSPGKAR